ncbi:monovalent cation/H(+) antiporter subunit G [Egicoccus sp. AB-alg2]|uniref:monovalent cation/H(+) antiporter subunit G n=1 Tax=Egicoccus sp. AB-alg2 TaxID=3242693 RepID=UPI00359D0725
MTDVIGAVLIGLGVFLVLLAGIGLLRFPDVFIRSSATTKAAGLGIALVLAGTAFAIGTPEAAVKMSIAIVLQFVGAPVSGHVIARAAYRAGAPLWDRTVTDELQGFVERPHETEVR